MPITPPRPEPPSRVRRKEPTKGRQEAAAGRFQVLNAFVDQWRRMVSPSALAVWLVLYRETKPDGLAQISHNQIADLIGLKRRATINATQELVEKGLVDIVKRGSAKTHEATKYKITTPPTGGKASAR